MQSLGRRFVLLWKKYERYINFSALALGFTFDLFLAKRPDNVLDNVLLVSYLFIVGAVIILLNINKLRRQMERDSPAEPLLLLLVVQFCFGGLANNLLILYGKSGTLGGSLLFVVLLGAFALGNEFLKGRYEQMRFNVAIYYFLLLTYCVIAVPTFVLHAIGVGEFLLSCLVSVVAISIFLAILFLRVFKKRDKKQMFEVSAIVCGILLVFNGLYFLNIIPPVPLSLKDIGVYHTLVRSDDLAGGSLFTATFDPAAWYIFWRDTSSTYVFRAGENAYCFSAVFAPGSLTTPIVHRWEKLDEQGKWQTQATYTFPINGGRAEGYRGYSYTAMTEGEWRCDVETQKGQLIGRISFEAIQGVPTDLASTTL